MAHHVGRAVIIDDDLVLCKYFSHVLQRAGMEVTCAHTGHAGVEAVRDHLPDVVILDINLPDIDGFEVCRLLKSSSVTADIPVLFVSASADSYVEAFRVGAADCVTKPVQGDVLWARIERLLAGQSLDLTDEDFPVQLRVIEQHELSLQIEAERKRMQEAMNAMDRTLGVLGHELRTPLAGLRVMTEFLLTNPSENGQSEQFLKAIHDEVLRLSDMVNNLLESARINSGEARWRWGAVSITDACHGAIKLLNALAIDNVNLVCDIQPEDLEIQGDADAIRRLVLNLLTNAQKYTYEGTISVHARPRTEDDGSWIELVVADTGTGIPTEVVEKLGVPFALNGGSIEGGGWSGAGLGLSICYSIAAAHGGTLAIESEMGKGTVVTVQLRSDLEQAATANPEESSPEVVA